MEFNISLDVGVAANVAWLVCDRIHEINKESVGHPGVDGSREIRAGYARVLEQMRAQLPADLQNGLDTPDF